MVFRHPGLEHYQRLIEAARSRLADLELDDGVEKSKVDSVPSRLFGALRPYYQERDRLRLLIQYRLDHTLMELRSLYEHLQARILELIEAYLGHPRFKNLGTANLANQANEESKDESSESFHSSS